jgi:hypothetical protein
LLSEPWAGPSREKLESTLEGPEASAVNINVINVELEPLILQRKLSKSFIARKHLILFFLISHAVDNDEFFFYLPCPLLLFDHQVENLKLKVHLR